jgi:DNA repair protein RecO (recombination protein O)
METIQGIILKIIPYKDRQQIVKIFTENHGLQGFMVRLSSDKKQQIRNLCRVMNLVEFEAQIKNEKNLHNMSQLRLASAMVSTPFDPRKGALMLFLAELLGKTMPDAYYNKPLYKFLFDALILLDDSDEVHNFHLWCTLEIIRHYGFYPAEGSTHRTRQFFDMLENTFLKLPPIHPYFLDTETTYLLVLLLDKDWSEVQGISTSGLLRKNLLEGLLQMINLQLELKINYNSLVVLHQVFHD